MSTSEMNNVLIKKKNIHFKTKSYWMKQGTN